MWESLQHRKRLGLTSYALVLDLKEAYDMVHLTTLWSVLETMGMPPELVDMLRR